MEPSLAVRKATISDLPAILKIYKSATEHMIASGIFQWNDQYPDEETLQADIASETMCLCEKDAAIAAVFVLNQNSYAEYISGNWQYAESSFFVVHRLCVNPAFQGMGMGTQAMLAAEAVLRKQGVEAIRLDTFSQNPVAIKLYAKLGYTQVGQFHLPRGLFYLFEKKL